MKNKQENVGPTSSNVKQYNTTEFRPTISFLVMADGLIKGGLDRLVTLFGSGV